MVTKITIQIKGKKPECKLYDFIFLCYETVTTEERRMENAFYKQANIKLSKKTILYECQILTKVERSTEIEQKSFQITLSQKYANERYVPPTKAVKSFEDVSRYLKILCMDIVFGLENCRSVQEEIKTRIVAKQYNFSTRGDLPAYLKKRYGISLKHKKIEYVF